MRSNLRESSMSELRKISSLKYWSINVLKSTLKAAVDLNLTSMKNIRPSLTT